MPPFSAMQQDVYVAIRTDGLVGSGTWDDPFDGSGTNFDTVMSTRINAITPPNLTIRLLPGTFLTNGNSADGTYSAWAPKPQMRIVGSGIGSTTLKLAPAASAARYAVAINFDGASGTVDGFEISDLTIDCGLVNPTPPTNCVAGAIRVRGSNVYVRRIKVVNYGTNSATTTVSVITAAGESSYNSIVEECVIDPPGAPHAGQAVWFSLEDPRAVVGHQFCTIRNCAGQGVSVVPPSSPFEPPPAISTGAFAAVATGVGLGTVVEGNQFVNVYHGILSVQQAAKDVVIWNNFLRNVFKGIRYDQQGSSSAVGRVIAIENTIELSRAVNFPIGLEFTGTLTNQFADVVTRRNIVRQISDPNRPVLANASGVALRSCTRAIAENNLVNDTQDNSAVWFRDCGSAKFFNNEDDAGKLLRGYDVVSGKFLQELADAVQDVLLPI